jgi:type VI secretion system secreted protein Hcp
MAVDIFLKLLPIKGESQDAKHKDEIDVLAWAWGMSQSGTTHHGSGGGAGKVSVNDLSFTHYVDKATPDLMKACATGQHIDEGTLVVRKAGGKDALEYLKIKMEEIIVTSINTGGAGSEDRLTENVSLNFRKVTTKYTPQTTKGAGESPGEFGWDIAANEEA